MNGKYETVCLVGSPMETQNAIGDVEKKMAKNGFRLIWAHVQMDHRFAVFYKETKHDR